MKVLAEIRRFASQALGSAEKILRMTGLESQAVAQVEPPGMEGARGGRRVYIGNNAAITGIANVTALPTTAAQWAIVNKSLKRSYFLEALGMYLTSGTPGVSGMLLACLYDDPDATGVNATGVEISSSADSSVLVRDLLVKASQTITTPAAPNWFPMAINYSPNVTAFAGQVVLENRSVQGRWAIRPGQALGLAVVAPAGTTPLFAPFAELFADTADME
jgi:hypothetical protein